MKTEIDWNQSVPTPKAVLVRLQVVGLKFELVMQWLEEVHDIRIDMDNKKSCSERDQMEKARATYFCNHLFAYDVVLEYKNKLEEKSNEVIPQYVQLGWQ